MEQPKGDEKHSLVSRVAPAIVVGVIFGIVFGSMTDDLWVGIMTGVGATYFGWLLYD